MRYVIYPTQNQNRWFDDRRTVVISHKEAKLNRWFDDRRTKVILVNKVKYLSYYY